MAQKDTIEHSRPGGCKCEELEARLLYVEQRLEHTIRHDRMRPTPGCTFCQVRNAASEACRAA